MKLLMILLGLAAAAAAQTPLAASISPATASPGQQVTLTLSLPASPVVGLQWDLNLSPVLAVGTAATPTKVISCAGVRCLVYGLNRTPIPAGPVATIVINIPPGTTPGSYGITPDLLIGVDANANETPLTGSTATLTVIRNKFDLDSDGSVTTKDVALAVLQALGLQPCADVTGDNRCTIKDVQAIFNAIP